MFLCETRGLRTHPPGPFVTSTRVCYNIRVYILWPTHGYLIGHGFGMCIFTVQCYCSTLQAGASYTECTYVVCVYIEHMCVGESRLSGV